jgi:hypothetical protein
LITAAILNYLRAVTLFLDILPGYLDTITVIKLGNIDLTIFPFHPIHLLFLILPQLNVANSNYCDKKFSSMNPLANEMFPFQNINDPTDFFFHILVTIVSVGEHQDVV